MKREKIFELALLHGIADKDLSKDDCLVSDYGGCTDNVISFTNAIMEYVLTQENKTESQQQTFLYKKTIQDYQESGEVITYMGTPIQELSPLGLLAAIIDMNKRMKPLALI